jgi:hypothetical protein
MILRLAYEKALVPDGGATVYATSTSLALSYGKEAAGHIFHTKALAQAGLQGELHCGDLRRPTLFYYTSDHSKQIF